MSVAREVLVDVPEAMAEAAVAAVYALGVMGVEVRDADVGAPRGRVQVVAWLPPTEATVRAAEALAEALDARVAWRDVPVTWEVPDPVPVGARFVLVPPGHASLGSVDRQTIVIEAGLAFGDGLHPTTNLCVEVLEALAPFGTVLDVGTGTGVLAIVAERLGATSVDACDVDPLAVWTARRNVAVNRARVTVGSELPHGAWDVVVANLYLAPLLGLIPALAGRAGVLVVSGFVVDARAAVEGALEAAGFEVATAATRDGWMALTGRPRG